MSRKGVFIRFLDQCQTCYNYDDCEEPMFSREACVYHQQPPPVQVVMCCGVHTRKGKCPVCGTNYNEDLP
jgi:hypothetical protein